MTPEQVRELVERLQRTLNVGDADEDDTDMFRPMSVQNARAPLLAVGDLRHALTVINMLKGNDHEG
jgi:hypothetical protein